MLRYLLDITYKGTHYAGWQAQPNALTVQEELDKALSTLLRQEVQTLGAGRTDAGVHARQLIVHFDWERALPEYFRQSLNGILPYDIAVNRVYRAKSPDFHARFDALSRAYVYQISLQKAPLEDEFALWVRQPLNFDKMNEAAALLLLHDDFASFCKAHGANKTHICRIEHAFWENRGNLWAFHIKADRFLRGMVRAVVGTLLEVGKGKMSPMDFEQVILAKDRAMAGPNVAAKGLSLTEVNYPPGSMEVIEPLG